MTRKICVAPYCNILTQEMQWCHYLFCLFHVTWMPAPKCHMTKKVMLHLISIVLTMFMPLASCDAHAVTMFHLILIILTKQVQWYQ